MERRCDPARVFCDGIGKATANFTKSLLQLVQLDGEDYIARGAGEVRSYVERIHLTNINVSFFGNLSTILVLEWL